MGELLQFRQAPLTLQPNERNTMPIYRVYGSIISFVYTDVSADSAEQAIEIAGSREPEDFMLTTETFGLDNEVEEIN